MGLLWHSAGLEPYIFVVPFLYIFSASKICVLAGIEVDRMAPNDEMQISFCPFSDFLLAKL